jgi:hypothetical protein
MIKVIVSDLYGQFREYDEFVTSLSAHGVPIA